MRPRTPLDWGLTTKGQQRTGVRRLFLLAAVILGLTVATRDKGGPEGDEAPPKPDRPPETVAVKPPTQPLWDEGEGPERSTPRPGARAQVPRVTRVDGMQPPPEAEGRPAATEQTLREAIDALLPEIEDCLHQWWMLQPDLAGELVVELRLGPEGLEDAAILDHDGVPAGVLSCFGAALYEGDFPAGPDEGMVVTWPFRFHGEDTGE